MFEVLKCLKSEIIKKITIIYRQIRYKLRTKSQFHMSTVYPIFNDTKSIKFIGLKLLEFILDEMK